MNIGFGQLIIILLLIVILFGKFPNLIRDLSKGIKVLDNNLKDNNLKDNNNKSLTIDSKSNKNSSKE